MDSIRASIPDTAAWKTSNVDRALTVMFPGPDAAPTSAPRRLFQAWDNQLTEELYEKYRSKSEAANDGNAVQWLCDRLTKNESVKPHLLLVRTLLFTLQPLSLLAKEPTTFTSMLPMSVPNPGPCMVRAVQMAEEACFSTDTVTDKGVGTICAYSQPLWYTMRMRLAFAYAASGMYNATHTRIGIGDTTQYDGTRSHRLVAAYCSDARNLRYITASDGKCKAMGNVGWSRMAG